jgi:hypothetical protein
MTVSVRANSAIKQPFNFIKNFIHTLAGKKCMYKKKLRLCGEGENSPREFKNPISMLKQLSFLSYITLLTFQIFIFLLQNCYTN